MQGQSTSLCVQAYFERLEKRPTTAVGLAGVMDSQVVSRIETKMHS